jgi:hypothetical protein
LGVPKTTEIKKVTTSQDDGLVGVLKNIPLRCTKNKRNQKRSQPLSGEQKSPAQTGYAQGVPLIEQFLTTWKAPHHRSPSLEGFLRFLRFFGGSRARAMLTV